MKSILFSVSIFIFWSISANAINIEWLDNGYDFGVFHEEEGVREGTIRFINKGTEHIQIKDVVATCGCTSTFFSQELIEPGDTAEINFTYNPVGRPGKINKALKIYIGPGDEMFRIPIRGTVIGSDLTLESRYPYKSGCLRLENNRIIGGELNKEKIKHFSLNLYNPSSDSVYVSMSSIPLPIDYKIYPEVIPPGEEGALMISYDPSKEKKYGKIEYIFHLECGIGTKQSKNIEINEDNRGDKIYFVAEYLPVQDFFNASALRENSLWIESDLVDLGKIEGRANFNIRLKNIGENMIEIKNVYSMFDSVNISHFPDQLPLNATGEIKGYIEGSEVGHGPFRLPIRIISDDPFHPVLEIRVVGEI